MKDITTSKNSLSELFGMHTTWDRLFLRRLPCNVGLYWCMYIQLHVNNDFKFSGLLVYMHPMLHPEYCYKQKYNTSYM